MYCDNCGLKVNDGIEKCPGCGAAFEKRPSESELSWNIDKMTRESDPLIPSRLDRVMKWVFITLAPVYFILCVFFTSEVSFAFILFFINALGALTAGSPATVFTIETMRFRIYTNADDFTPNEFFTKMRRLSYFVLLGLSTFLLINICLLS